jgi:hypothetical protein
MSISYFTGFEENDLTVDAWTVTNATVSSTYSKTGTYSLKCLTSASTAFINKSFGTCNRFSFHMRIVTMPDVDVLIFRSGTVYVYLTTEGYRSL